MTLLRLPAVAKALTVSEKCLRNWIYAGSLKAVRIGRNWKIPQAELDRLINEGSVRAFQ